MPDIGLVRGRGHVGDLADRVRHPAHLGQAARRQHLTPLLELQPGHHAEQVGVAGPLAVAVRGALDVRGPGRHGRQGVGHRARRVVVAVDAQPRAGSVSDRGHHVTELGGQHAAVGVAQRHQVGAGLHRRAHHLERVGRVGPVAVEEVLGVEENPPGPRRAGD